MEDSNDRERREGGGPESSEFDRRTVGRLFAGGAAGLAATSAFAIAAAGDKHEAPGLAFQFEIRAEVAKPIELGQADGITKRTVPIIGGTVQGPMLTGEVLPGGADSQTIHADGTTEILARYLIRATDGAIIEVVNPGIRKASPEILHRLATEDNVDPHSYYFRTTPSFATTAPAYKFLTQSVFVCTGIRRLSAAILSVFAVL